MCAPIPSTNCTGYNEITNGKLTAKFRLHPNAPGTSTYANSKAGTPWVLPALSQASSLDKRPVEAQSIFHETTTSLIQARAHLEPSAIAMPPALSKSPKTIDRSSLRFQLLSHSSIYAVPSLKYTSTAMSPDYGSLYHFAKRHVFYAWITPVSSGQYPGSEVHTALGNGLGRCLAIQEM